MGYRLLKFDIVHPEAYLEQKKSKWPNLEELSATQYRERLISLRSNYSDFYTHYLNELGWEAEEFFLLDDTYINKLGKELFGITQPYEKLRSKISGKVRLIKYGWRDKVIRAYIEEFQPDVIFARSQPIPSTFWQRYRNRCLLVSRLSARLPYNWHPNHWDLIYTDLDVFKDFFEAHDVPTKINKQGFDPRVLDDLEHRGTRHNIVFVGGMGTENFSNRTHFFEEIASKTNFKWWGYWWEYGGWGSLDDFPNLKKSFQGSTSGIDMYQIYNDSKIVLNDYVDTSQNIGFNQRMFEVMGVGAFMLTRKADNFETQFPDDIFETFSSADSCLEKITYYLKNEQERTEIGKRGQSFVKGNYHFRDIAIEFHNDLIKMLEE